MTAPARTTNEHDERLHELIAAYLDREAAGAAPPRDAWLAEHAEFADELRRFLDEHERMGRVGAPLRQLADAPPVQADCPTLADNPRDTAVLPSDPARHFGDYELLCEAARGGMGVVYKARQKSLNRIVALKMILAGRLATPAEVQRFHSEAQAAAELDHPNIVAIYEVSEHEGQHYFAMRYVEGENLAHAIAVDRWPRATRGGQRGIAELLAQLARAVQYAHDRGILHRDLKPANVLLASQGSGIRSQGSGIRGQEVRARGQEADSGRKAVGAKPPSDSARLTPDPCLLAPVITDFGLAKRVGGADAALTNTGAVVGTPSYMAPEQAAGNKQITTAADVYSLGAILFELLTGRPPFVGDSTLSVLAQVAVDEPIHPRRLNPAVERDLATICLKCLDKDPARRYRSAEALADDLDKWLAGEPIEARPSTPWERTVKWARRRPALAALVGVIIVSAAALLTGGLVFNAELQVALGQVRKQRDDLGLAQQQLEQTQNNLDEAKTAVEREEQAAKQAGARAEQLLLRADSLRLVAHSEITRPREPALALLLALEAAKRGPRRADQNNALAKALAECREVGPLLKDHQGHGVSLVRWLPDGKRVLTVAHDTVRIWDAVSGAKLVEFDGPHLRILSLALSPDGRLLATIFEYHWEHEAVMIAGRRQERKPFLVTDQVARVYDTHTGRELHVLRGHRHRVKTVAFGPDGKRLVTASTDGTARLWDAATGKELRVFEGHECSLAAAEFTHDGRVLTVSSGQKLRNKDNPLQRLLDRYAAEAVDPPLPAPFRTLSGGSSHGGSTGPLQGEDLFACIWDADTGGKLTEFRTSRRGDVHSSRHARLDPTGKHLVATTLYGAFVSDARTGKEIRALKYKDEPTGPPSFSADGKRVLVPFRRAVRVWDVENGQEIAMVRGEGGEFHFARFSPDPQGQAILTTSEDRTACLWQTVGGAALLTLRGHEQGIVGADFSPDGRRLITAGNDRSARIWNVEPRNDYERIIGAAASWLGVEAGTTAAYQRQRNAVWAAALSPDGTRFATGGYDGTLRLYETKTGKLLATRRGYEKLGDQKLRDRLLHEIFAIQYSPDGARLLTVSGDPVADPDPSSEKSKAAAARIPYMPVRIHDAATGAEICGLEGHREGVRLARFSPDGSKVLTVAADRFAIARVSPWGELVGSGTGSGKDRTARLFDAATGRQLQVFQGDWTAIYGACCDAKGERLAIVTDGLDPRGFPGLRVIHVWDVKSGVKSHRLVEERNNISSAQFSPDGRRLLAWYDTRIRQNSSSGQINEARVWDLAGGKVLFTLQGAAGAATFAAYSPDGKWIATTGYVANSFTSGGSLGILGRTRDTYFADRTARLWNADTGALAAVLHGHERSVHEAAFSADSRWLVTVSEDRTARVWEVPGGKEFITLRGHDDAVKTAAFSPDAKSVLTVSWDGTARLWPVDPLPLALERRPRDLTDEERERFELSSNR